MRHRLELRDLRFQVPPLTRTPLRCVSTSPRKRLGERDSATCKLMGPTIESPSPSASFCRGRRAQSRMRGPSLRGLRIQAPPLTRTPLRCVSPSPRKRLGERDSRCAASPAALPALPLRAGPAPARGAASIRGRNVRSFSGRRRCDRAARSSAPLRRVRRSRTACRA